VAKPTITEAHQIRRTARSKNDRQEHPIAKSTFKPTGATHPIPPSNEVLPTSLSTPRRGMLASSRPTAKLIAKSPATSDAAVKSTIA
jgi:hypothetical protein